MNKSCNVLYVPGGFQPGNLGEVNLDDVWSIGGGSVHVCTAAPEEAIGVHATMVPIMDALVQQIDIAASQLLTLVTTVRGATLFRMDMDPGEPDEASAGENHTIKDMLYADAAGCAPDDGDNGVPGGTVSYPGEAPDVGATESALEVPRTASGRLQPGNQGEADLDDMRTGAPRSAQERPRQRLVYILLWFPQWIRWPCRSILQPTTS